MIRLGVVEYLLNRLGDIKIKTDHIGIILSCTCLIHCLVLPFILLGMGIYTDSLLIHSLFLLGAVLVTGHAVYHSYKKHCKHIVLFFAFLGIFFLGIDVFAGVFGDHVHSYETVAHGDHTHIDFSKPIDNDFHLEFFTIIGSVFLITTHMINLFYSRRSSNSCGACNE